MSLPGNAKKPEPTSLPAYRSDGRRAKRARPSPAPPSNLITPPNTFIGRGALVDEICALVLWENVKLLTLTGPGGVGKTRVAIESARHLLPEFAEGAWFVSLAPIGSPEMVIPAIASALGVREVSGTPLQETLKLYLQERSLLLLLDNFEQVVRAAPDVAHLIASAPGVQVIVTSRMPLRVYGEHEYAVPPMDVPGADLLGSPESAPDVGQLSSLATLKGYDAIGLFLARTREIHPRFNLSRANARHIVEICARLDGLPLAIELAVARLRIFTPQALLSRLDKALPLLEGGARDLPARQQTLRNTIAWSYDLLDKAEQKVFEMLAVFVGGCTLEAAEKVYTSSGIETSDPLADSGQALVVRLESLIAQNLLRRREQEDGEPRFLMLATIREYALEKLSEQGAEQLNAVHAAHAHFFAEIAEAAKEAFKGGQPTQWLTRIDAEHDNMRAALRWSIDRRESDVALRLAIALDWFWYTRGYLVEGSRWLEEALAIGEEAPIQLRAQASYSGSWLGLAQNDFARTEKFAQQSLELYRAAGDKLGVAKSLSPLGVVAAEQEDYALALSRFEESLAVWRELENANNVALLVGNLCFLAILKGDYELAIAYGEESLSIQRARGDTIGIVGTGINLGLALLHARDYVRGVALLEECLAKVEEIGGKKEEALAHTYLGLAALLQDDHEGAEPHYKESLELSQELGNRFGIARSLVGLSRVALEEGHARNATMLSGSAHKLITTWRLKLVPDERALDEGTREQARANLGEAAFIRAWEQGQAMTEEQSILFALRNEAPQLPEPAPLQISRDPLPIAQRPEAAGDLSAREVEVVRLMAAGLTNKEISERLVLSPRTVQTHLYNIFSKLNVTTRSAATRYAIERGLV